MEGKKDAPIIGDASLRGLARREPPGGRQNSQAAENRRPSELGHKSLRRGRVVLQVPFDWDPI